MPPRPETTPRPEPRARPHRRASTVWVDDAFYDRDSLPPGPAVLFGTSLGLSPVCYLREHLLFRHQLDALGRAAASLGYTGFDADAAGHAVVEAGVADALVALVPTPVDHKAAAPGDDWTLLVEPFDPPDASEPLRLAVSPHRRNHRSPTVNALLLGDCELLTGAGEAAAARVDDVVWLQLDDAVSCIGAGAVFADVDGEIITPPLADGVPDTAWRSACVDGSGAVERRFDIARLRAAASVACVWPWGSVQSVGTIDGRALVDGSLASRLATALTATGSRP